MRYPPRWMLIRAIVLEPTSRKRRIGGGRGDGEARERKRRIVRWSNRSLSTALSFFSSTTTEEEPCNSLAFSFSSLLYPYLSPDPASQTRRRLHHTASPWEREEGNGKQKNERENEDGSERKKSPSRCPATLRKMRKRKFSVLQKGKN